MREDRAAGTRKAQARAVSYASTAVLPVAAGRRGTAADRTGEAGRKKPTGRKAPPVAPRGAEVELAGVNRRPAAGSDRAVSGRVMGNQQAYFVLIPTVLLLMTGLVMVFSAGSAYGLNHGVGQRYFLQQLVWAVLGCGAMAVTSKLDYHRIGRISSLILVVAFAMLCAVLVIGFEAGGSRRWIAAGPINIQPTEIAKFAIVVFAAWALANKGARLKEFKHFALPVMAVTAAAMLLMLAQPDLGSSLVLFFAILLMAGVSYARISHVTLALAAGVGAGAFFMLSESYRRARWLSFLNPWKSPTGYGYQVIQSYVALGTGNIKGVGLGMSRQKFLYLPNAHTDFIFAIIGEEFGIFGTLVVVSLLALLTVGGFRIAARAPDQLGMLLATGITSLIIIQALVNIGGVTGLLPITGVPLPLVSFGGSSLCITMASIGILLNIASQSRN